MPRASIAIPTLFAGQSLYDCLAALRQQSFQDFEVVVIDNSNRNLVHTSQPVRLIAPTHNIGFGAAINRAFEQSSTPYLISLNDDAVPHPGWLAALIATADANPKAGMLASQVRLSPAQLDSAGMLIYGDGSSKQRGHGEPPDRYSKLEEVLLPSGSAALYRRTMLDEVGLFDESFFLYCEDTDLGLRARRAGWTCLYVPDAVVDHAYSQSAGRVSPLKAYLVERNRMFVLLKNFPMSMLAAAPIHGSARYYEHFRAAIAGSGKTGEFARGDGGMIAMAAIPLKAHIALLLATPRLLAQRSAIARSAKLTDAAFSALLRQYATTAKELANH